MFQSTRPYGARRYLPGAGRDARGFQSTRPYGARRTRTGAAAGLSCFNPRARMGRDEPHKVRELDYGVSIHAPVWGATQADDPRLPVPLVSIHAPVWGATCGDLHSALARTVSIHAPVWGATWRMAFTTFTTTFQSTRPYGARPPGYTRIPVSDPFQSTRPYGARPGSWPAGGWPGCFNPRARMGRDLECSVEDLYGLGFNPRARMGRDAPSAVALAADACFNPRARMGRDPQRQPMPALLRCFNPRARMGRDVCKVNALVAGPVSIHAPVWGATRRSGAGGARPTVSIHAPVWGATVRVCIVIWVRGVSIHAPVWGATVFDRALQLTELFQSTRPYGARRSACARLCGYESFNPRARMGRDVPLAQDCVVTKVSIHAPVWGATRDCTYYAQAFNVSIHAPVWGATAANKPKLPRPDVSIHAPVWGATCAEFDHADAFPFQSTRPYGARRTRTGAAAGLSCFNPRARMGRDPPTTRPGRTGPRFNPRARMGRDLASGPADPIACGFNPRARMGRDDATDRLDILVVVSIHAPVWGATRPQTPLQRFFEFQSTRPYGARRRRSPSVCARCSFQSTRPYGARPAACAAANRPRMFQSTRPYGARQAVLLASGFPDSFNPRARMGRDRSACARLCGYEVSIHAPVWGATFTSRDTAENITFQSTRPYGARHDKARAQNPSDTFQSTRPYGARRGSIKQGRRKAEFQSTRPYGARHGQP